MKLNFALLLLWAALVVIPLAAQPQHSSVPSPKSRADAAAEAVHLNNLRAAYMNQQQFARALNLFRRAAVLNPKLEIARINEGMALANLQKYNAAAKLLNTLGKKDPNNPHIWYTLGLVYKNQANSEKSRDAF